MRCGRRSLPGCWRSSVCTRRWGAVGSREWRRRSMLVKPDKETPVKRIASGARRRVVSILITLIILGGLGYIGWVAFGQKPQQGAGNRFGAGRTDLPVPVLAATPR